MSVGLCRLLGLEHSLAATVACLLSSPLGEETKILSLLRVGCDPRSASIREGKRGVPGQLVTAADAELLVSFLLSTLCVHIDCSKCCCCCCCCCCYHVLASVPYFHYHYPTLYQVIHLDEVSLRLINNLSYSPTHLSSCIKHVFDCPTIHPSVYPSHTGAETVTYIPTQRSSGLRINPTSLSTCTCTYKHAVRYSG